MSAHFILELDTTAPEVEFGDPGFAAGVLTIPYIVDEPGVLAAVLEIEGVSYPMVVGAATLSVEVTENIEDGLVRVTTQDAVWNQANFVLPGIEVRAYRVERPPLEARLLSPRSRANLQDPTSEARLVRPSTEVEYDPESERLTIEDPGTDFQ